MITLSSPRFAPNNVGKVDVEGMVNETVRKLAREIADVLRAGAERISVMQVQVTIVR